MADKNKTLRVEEKDQSDTALLLIDVISDFDFEHGPELLAQALPMARNLVKLKRSAKQAGVPTIYVNDNLGKWQEDFKALVAYCRTKDGREIVDLLAPQEDDYFVLKPKHSAFYSTALDLLLRNLRTEKLILTGLSTDICVLFSANDAYMRDYKLFIPNDCVAAVKPAESQRTLDYMERVLQADIRAAQELDLMRLA